MQDQDKLSGSNNYSNGFGRGRHHHRGRSQNPSGYYNKNKLALQQQAGVEGYPEENLQLVPCRWSHTGWKYVQCDPAKTQFFSSPNRVNSFGFKNGKKQQRLDRSVGTGNFNPVESEF